MDAAHGREHHGVLQGALLEVAHERAEAVLDVFLVGVATYKLNRLIQFESP